MQVNIPFSKQIRRLRFSSHHVPVEVTATRRYASLITVGVVLVVWQLVVMLRLVSPALVPEPLAVAQKFGTVLENGRWWLHTSTTLIEVLTGLVLGVGVALALGYFIAKSRLLEDLLSPIIVTMQSTPVVAYAPLLIIWFGSGSTSKVVICALIVFFPMLMNTVVGIRSVPNDLYDLMRVTRATRWQTLSKLEIPGAMPILLTGLKTSATLSVIGAVVGEFINANAGIGFMISVARNQFDTSLVYVGVITLALMARTLYGLVSMLERRLLTWQRFS